MAVVFSARFLLLLVAFLRLLQLPIIMADCPLDLSGGNLTQTATLCSDDNDRGKCCRSINAFVAISVTRYANQTSILGVNPNLFGICLNAISETLTLRGVPRNATMFCGLGKKILVNYECDGRTTVTQMLQSPKFVDVIKNCNVPLAVESSCWKCLNAGSVYLHHLVRSEDNLTLSTCRDATFSALASQVDDVSGLEIANCFFGIQELHNLPGISSLSPEASSSNFVAASPSQFLLGTPQNATHHRYRLKLLPGVGLAVTVIAVTMLVVLIFLIRRKSRELDDSGVRDKTNSKSFSQQPVRKFEDGPSSMFCKFSYKETKKATGNFNTVIGQGGFGTVYKAQFSNGLVAAVKRMSKVTEQAENDFCREIDLLARLNHRHLVTLIGFCIVKHERFLMYEYMTNGSLKDHLHTPIKTPLSWQNRIQIAIDVANSLEYLHFYCDPPLCHRDIKSSNILLDAKFIAKVADFGILHASKDDSIFFEPVNTGICGTPGYMDPEYVITQELTEKSDIYSYGVLLLEIVTARPVIQDNKNLVEWSQKFMASESRIPELVDPRLRDSFDLDQLQTIVSIVKWCTKRTGQDRPSIKQVLGLLYECSDPMYRGFLQAVEDEEYEGNEGSNIQTSKGKTHKSEASFNLASSSSTSVSYFSRNFLFNTGSPQSPTAVPSP